MTVPIPPRQPRQRPPTPPDRDSFDPGWALGRVPDLLLGPGLLTAHITLFVLVTVGVVFWRLAQTPETFSLPRILVLWAVLVLLHASVVVVWVALRGRRSPRRAPVYYRDIPDSERTRSWQPAAPPDTAATSDGGAPLASVTPFPTWRSAASPRRSDAPPPVDAPASAMARTPDAASSPPANRPSAPPPIPDANAPSLAEARTLLAGEQPAWRRMFRRGSDTPSRPAANANGNGNGNGTNSWLSPFPDTGSVTRPRASSGPHFPTGDWMADNGTPSPPPPTASPATNGHRPTRPRPNEHPAERPPANGQTDQPPTDDQLPSLAAMLRERNLLTLAEAPHKPTGRSRSGEREGSEAPTTPPAPRTPGSNWPDSGSTSPKPNGRPLPPLREVARRQTPPR